ncbi:ESX secretion-associated protein EspG [Mycobacterium sp. 29Ha]|uniref:ESX secretion-associated protein EspG n=1 Tax=Mycobacterium sp. 29Ha TaxID=2939268 RepID=UPI00293914E5|nr:ESX secretion-associated protein EspG [Mycobacterium sp. 29Ha]MDV3133311.1 ESX secretion-associated protein EspG [Mycobacterium sp. 29Ha]
MWAESTEVTPDVTVNLEGLWLLQALLGIPTLAPELRLRPYGAARSNDWQVDHPGIELLREQGLVDDTGQVLSQLASRLQVLAAPDVEVAVLISRGGPLATAQMNLDDPATWRAIPDDQLRIVLARRGGRWVSAARAGEDVTIDDVAGGGIEWLAAVVCGQLDVVHPAAPSRIPALNVAVEDLMSVAAERAAMPADAPGRDMSLRTLGVSGAALAELAAVIDSPVAEAVMYARGYLDGDIRPGRTVLDVRDTEAGRVVMYQMAAVRGSGQDWMTIAPASGAQVEQGVRSVLASVDVANWDTHERM